MSNLKVAIIAALGGAFAYHVFVSRRESQAYQSVKIPASWIGSKEWVKSKENNVNKLKAEADALMAQAAAVRTQLVEKYKGYTEAIPSDWDAPAKKLEQQAKELLNKSMMIA